jgi:uracil DNA glycosylase
MVVVMVFNAQSKRKVEAFLNEDDSITLVQSHPSTESDGGFVEHRVTIGIGDLAEILSEFGLADIEYTEDKDE